MKEEYLNVRLERKDVINYDITAHTNGYINFILSSSPINEKELYDSPDDIINNIKIKN